jgi:hypothetical protein
MSNFSKYGFLYLGLLDKYKGDNIKNLKFGMTNRSDYEKRIKEHEKMHGCNFKVLLLIKTKNTSFYESNIKIVLSKFFDKIHKTHEYFIYKNENDTLRIIDMIKSYIKLDKQQYNLQKESCIYYDYYGKVNLTQKIVADSYNVPRDIEKIIENNDWTIPMDIC